MQAKVISEKYRIVYSTNGQECTEAVEYKDAYWRAFQLAGALRCRVVIQRITTVETPAEAKQSAFFTFLDGIGDKTTDIVTGGVVIDAEHFARDTELSRYHSNNGWLLPEYISDFENAVVA